MRKIQLFKASLKLLAVCGLWWITASFASTKPNVVVSIIPLHALVSAVMENVAEPKLLVQKGASPHHYNLRPSEIQALQQANLIFWAGPELETFLVKPLQSLETHSTVVELDKTDKLLLLPPRRSVAFQSNKSSENYADDHMHEKNHTPKHAHKHEKDHTQKHTHKHESNHTGEHNHEGGCCGGDHGPMAKDMHFWLDPNNAKVMLIRITDELSKIDPANKEQYRSNAKKFMAKLEALDRNLKIKLKPIQKMPYVVFHDAYQYFEHHYGLKGVGAISIHPELPLSLQRLYEVRESIIKTKAICIFREPQFKSQLVENLGQETKTRVGELDPLGESNAKDGSDYLHLLENIADSLKGCLMDEAMVKK